MALWRICGKPRTIGIWKGEYIMELATINAKGQITLPMSIQKHLKLNSGDRIAFVCEGEKVVITSDPIMALKEVQTAFQGAAEEAGLYSEDDVVRMVKEVRAERQEK